MLPISYLSSNTTTTISLFIQNSSNIKRNGQCGCSPLVKIPSLINALQARPPPRRQMHLFRKILPTILDQMTFPTRLSVCKTFTFLVINVNMSQIILSSPLHYNTMKSNAILVSLIRVGHIPSCDSSPGGCSTLDSAAPPPDGSIFPPF